MTHAKRILSLLLIALMALALLPSAAFADPPQADPTHTHSWKVVSNTATCTEGGLKTWKCSACGKTYSEKIDALGHSWDEGVITVQPAGFTPGVRTYTCTRDGSHTYTEAIDPEPWLFATLQGGTKASSRLDLPPLTITREPENGAITRYADEELTLSVAVTGGMPPYTYAWYAQARDAWAGGAANKFAKWFLNLVGASPAEVDAAKGNPLSTGSTCTVEAGDRYYWCVVTDREQNTVTSQRALVSYRLRIDDQPDNGNLDKFGVVMLTCAAADGQGAGTYEYYWYNGKGSYCGKSPSFKATSSGEYYCEVTDGVDTVRSETASVYYKKPFKLTSITPNCELVSGEPAPLAAAFTGGTEDYEIWWDKDGTAIRSTEGFEEAGYSSTVISTESGVYTVHAVDAMGETVQASVVRKDKLLSIANQPRGGAIPRDGYATISVLVSGGEGPYYYALYRNGESLMEGSADTPAPNGTPFSFAVWTPGEYYFHIEDANGLYVDSNRVMFEDAVFRVKNQTNSAILANLDGFATLSVEAAGGVWPYTYLWTVARDGQRFQVGDDSKTIVVREPGEYLCRVTDQEGLILYSRRIPVQYIGDTPCILRQPIGGELASEGGAIELSCRAVSGTGREADLAYAWEKKVGDGRYGWRSASRSGDPTLLAVELGEYRCKVTDTTTGKSAYSEIALVSQALTINGVAKVGVTSQGAAFRLAVTGGRGPYTVRVFQQKPRWTFDGWEQEEALYLTETFDTLEALNDRRFDLEGTVAVVDPMSRSPQGGWLRSQREAQYYAVISDADNHSARSAVFGR